MTTAKTLTGHDAIRYAAERGLKVHKHADPTEGARDVDTDEAKTIAQEDPSLLWIEVQS